MIEIGELKRTVIFCSDKIIDFENKLLHFNDVIAAVSKLESENSNLKKEVSLLNAKINNIEKQNRQNNIEIQNVPYKSGENLIEMVNSIGSSMGVQVEPRAIDYVTRVPTSVKDKHKNIIVRFSNKNDRDNFLANYRKKRATMGSTHAGITVSNVADRLYINEHLTLADKIIFKQARELAKHKGYKYVWTHNGNVLIRRDDNSRIIHISSENDISRL
ncbi:uncharacterized protein LOC123316934 [Coccinella septempunctata]|uniref:uncharacterized protein LOC123316934 n=1 Tax=Coccinella septempunctata TaxID=41139 RepID=UPI001D06860B|nr:uncharacterized protein LOC123316934 [Coccinella septempunctata]